jgi:hypothetical protein
VAQKLSSIQEEAIVSFTLAYVLAAALPAAPMGLRTAARVAAQPRALQLLALLGLRALAAATSECNSDLAALGVFSSSELRELDLIAASGRVGKAAGAATCWALPRAAMMFSKRVSVS